MRKTNEAVCLPFHNIWSNLQRTKRGFHVSVSIYFHTTTFSKPGRRRKRVFRHNDHIYFKHNEHIYFKHMLLLVTSLRRLFASLQCSTSNILYNKGMKCVTKYLRECTSQIKGRASFSFPFPHLKCSGEKTADFVAKLSRGYFMKSTLT